MPLSVTKPDAMIELVERPSSTIDGNADDSAIYSYDSAKKSIEVTNLATGDLRYTIDLDELYPGVACDWQLRNMYSCFGKSVRAIDMGCGKWFRQVELPYPATGLVLTKDKNTLFVTMPRPDADAWLYIINVADFSIARRISVIRGAKCPALSPDGNSVFIVGEGNRMDVVQTKTMQRNSIYWPTAGQAQLVKTSPSGERIFVVIKTPDGESKLVTIDKTKLK